MYTKDTKTLVNFFKNDYDILGRDLNFCMNHLNENERGFCQCFSEKFIEKSSDSKLMRSFMLCSTFFDQFFYTHYRSIYTEFSNEFNFPKIYAHGMGGHASPSWFVYKFHGYDKKAFGYEVRAVRNFCDGPTCVTCDDGIQNGYETGVDCGGHDCIPCITIQERLDAGETPCDIYADGAGPPVDSLYGRFYEGGLIFYFDTLTCVGMVATNSDVIATTWGCSGTPGSR